MRQSTTNATYTFTKLDNQAIDDTRLTPRALALYVKLMRRPSDWIIRVCELAKSTGWKKSTVQAALRELEDCGYAELRSVKDEQGLLRGRQWTCFRNSKYAPLPTTDDHTYRPSENSTLLRNTKEEYDVDDGEKVGLSEARSTARAAIFNDSKSDNSCHSKRPNTTQSPLGRSWGRTLEDWVEALESKGLKPVASGNGYSAHCPCHRDRKRSLSIARGETKSVVAHCHAGCEFQEIVDFLFQSASSAQPTIYTYTDEHDRPVHRITRGVDKSFSVQHFENGKWVRGCGKGVRYPYRLPQLKRAISNRETVYIVEGEKDVESARRVGLVATCNLFGAGKWQSSLNPWFKGASVTIIADRDIAGYKHAETIRDALSSVAHDVRVVESDRGKDLTDHLDLKGTVFQLVRCDLNHESLLAA